MDNNPPQINIVKSSSGGGFQMPKLPKVSPLVIVLVTVLLAVVTVVSVFLLYQKRETPIAAPTPAAASTTQTISDTFSGTGIPDPNKWSYAVPTTGGSVSQANGTLNMVLPAASATASANTAQNGVTQYFTGDFSAKVDLVGIQTTGTAWQQFSFGSTVVSVRRTKSPAGEIVQAFGAATGQASLPAGTSTITVEIKRIGTVIQTFYSLPGGTPVLLSTILSGPGLSADGALYLTASTEAPDYSAATASFDNFTANVNFAEVQPTPIPGSAAACALNFTVLDTVPTNTPGPTATPSPTVTGTPPATPTPTATPPPGATPTPQPTPASCNNACTTNAQCTNGLICSNGACRNPQCTSESSCTCPVATPTPTTPIVSVPTPTPVILQTAGSMTGTLLLGLGGALILGL